MDKQTRRMSAELIAAAALVALVALPSPRAAQATPPPPSGTWPFWRYNMQRTNRVPSTAGSATITQPALKWTYPVGGISQATVADITGPNGLPDGNREVLTWGDGRLRAFTRDGAPLWTSDIIPNFELISFIGDVDDNGAVEILVYAAGDEWSVVALSGANGQTLSQIREPRIGRPRPPTVGDIDGDGKAELFEMGTFGAQSSLSVYRYATAITPTLVTTYSFSNTYQPAFGLIGDVNGDSTQELIYVSVQAAFTALNPTTYLTVPRQITTTGSMNSSQTTLTDVLPLRPGMEVLGVWFSEDERSVFALADFGPAPTYTLTTTWILTRPLQYFPVAVLAARLAASSTTEILVRYFDETIQQWRLEILAGATGATLTQTVGAYWCGAPNLDNDPSQEVMLCSVLPTGISMRAYDWDSGQNALVPKWAQPQDIQGIAGYADFDGDGLNDVAVVATGETSFHVYKGLNGALLGQYAFPAGYDCAAQWIAPVRGTSADVLLACSDGYVRLLNNSLQEQWAVYAAAGGAYALVVDTNNDQKNEVLAMDGRRNLRNLDPYTATLLAMPKTNWMITRTLTRTLPSPFTFHLFDTNNDAIWEYPIFNSTARPTHTLSLITKDPSTTLETTQASHTFLAANSTPFVLGAGQLDAHPNYDLLVTAPGTNTMRALSGASLAPIWIAPSVGEGIDIGAINDMNGDGHDDLWETDLPGIRLYSGQSGSVMGVPTYTAGASLPMIAQLDGDAALELISVGGVNDTNAVYKFVSPTLNTVYGRVITGSAGRVAAVADASLSEPGLEILYRAGGMLAAMSGISPTDIYTRLLGIEIVLGTCQPVVPRTGFAYSAAQISSLSAFCPSVTFDQILAFNINDIVVADVDGDDGGQDEILAGSDNGFLYALHAENGNLLWAYNFYYPVERVIVANVDNDAQLEILVSLSDGFLYALDQQQALGPPQAIRDGADPVVDADQQTWHTCYVGHIIQGGSSTPDGYRVALRHVSGALLTDGYLNVLHTGSAANPINVTLCVNHPDPQRRLVTPLVVGQTYYLEVISYQAGLSSASKTSDGALVIQTTKNTHVPIVRRQ